MLMLGKGQRKGLPRECPHLLSHGRPAQVSQIWQICPDAFFCAFDYEVYVKIPPWLLWQICAADSALDASSDYPYPIGDYCVKSCVGKIDVWTLQAGSERENHDARGLYQCCTGGHKHLLQHINVEGKCDVAGRDALARSRSRTSVIQLRLSDLWRAVWLGKTWGTDTGYGYFHFPVAPRPVKVSPQLSGYNPLGTYRAKCLSISGILYILFGCDL